MKRARRFLIRGKVQGVGFRYFALRQAHAAGVSGYVRNQPDGSVEVWAEGRAVALDAYETDLRQGPTFSRVEDVTVECAASRGERGFRIE